VGSKSAVAKASNKSSSVRTTIPEKIAKALSIEPGDILDWELTEEKGRQILKVRKLQ
jgi:bifunctional DNA-binding transcriptional regulator/antitoxin component of YhaV-PrlF toxin-antitoxin module